jgi:hypothetical protein
MAGTRVTCEDVETGESESEVIENDYLVVCDGDRYIDGIQIYSGTGTAVITVKRRIGAAHSQPQPPEPK